MVDSHRIAQTLRRAQQSALNLMKDTCRVEWPTGNYAMDMDTALPSYEMRVVYEGCCRIQSTGGIAQQSTASATGDSSNIGGSVPVATMLVHLPIGTQGVCPGCIVTVLDSLDRELVDMRLRLVSLQSAKTMASAQRWYAQHIPEGAAHAD